MRQMKTNPPGTQHFERKADEIREYRNYEYTVLETELKISNNLLEKLKMMPPEHLGKQLNIQLLLDSTRVKIAAFERD